MIAVFNDRDFLCQVLIKSFGFDKIHDVSGRIDESDKIAFLRHAIRKSLVIGEHIVRQAKIADIIKPVLADFPLSVAMKDDGIGQ